MALISQWTKTGTLIKTIDISATNLYPIGATTDRKYLWIFDGNLQIEQYDKLGNLMQSFAVPVATSESGDITTDRKFLWYTDAAAASANQIDKSGNLMQSWTTTNIPSGITTDRKFIWIIESDEQNCYIRQYTKAGVLTQSMNITMSINSFWCPSITTDRKHLWIADYENQRVHRFDKSGNLIQSWVCSPNGEGPTGITTDRKYLWITSVWD
jgi:streptogramin lyase